MGQVYEIQEPEEIELLLQVNGKMHGSLKVPFNASGEETNLIDQLQEERCKLAAELAAARAQEPVSYRYKFTHPISGEPVWRDSSPMWNGQCVQEVQPLFAAPVPPVREPLSYRDILRIYNEVGPEDGVPYRFAGAIEAAIKEQA